MHDTGGFTSSSDTSSHTSDISSHTSHTSHTSPSSDGMSMNQYLPTPAPTLNPVDYGGGFTATSSGGMSVGLMIAIAAGILLPIVLSLVAFLAVG